MTKIALIAVFALAAFAYIAMLRWLGGRVMGRGKEDGTAKGENGREDASQNPGERR